MKNSLRNIFHLLFGLMLIFGLAWVMLAHGAFSRWRNAEAIAHLSRSANQAVAEMVVLLGENRLSPRLRYQWEHSLDQIAEHLEGLKKRIPECEMAELPRLLSWSEEVFELWNRAETAEAKEIYHNALSTLLLDFSARVNSIHLNRAVAGRRAAKEHTFRLLAFLALINFLVLFGIWRFFLSRLLAPLERMGRAVRAFGEGRKNTRAPASGLLELDLIAGEFNLAADGLNASTASLEKEMNERRQGEENLQQSEHRLQVLLRDKEELLEKVLKAEIERKKLEENFRQIDKFQAVSRMAGGIAHRYNNMLAAVIGNLELVMESLPGALEPADELAEALEAARRAADLGGSLLAFLGQKPGNLQPLDFSESCRHSLLHLCKTLPGIVTVEEDLPSPGPMVLADCTQLRLAVGHLLSNALESLEEGPGTISARIHLESPADISATHRVPLDFEPGSGLYACLEVRDTGCGIPETEVQSIFDPFYSTKFTGRGLGLSVTLGIAQSHQGCITVERAPGRGSAFKLYLPIAEKTKPQVF